MSKNKKLTDTAEIAVMAAVIAVCAWVTLPLSVPLTLQTFGVFLALTALGGVKGTASIALYILLGAAGAPVFSGFRGGVAVLAGPTGGYILGFLLTGVIYIIAQKAGKDKRIINIISLAAGLAACYAFGTLRFYQTAAQGGGSMTVPAILSVCVLPFVIPDGVKLALACVIAEKLPPRKKYR